MNKKVVIKSIVGALVLFLVGRAVAGGLFFHFETEAAGLQRRAQELGEKHAPLPTAGMKPLKDACAGKLTGGDATAIVGYVAKMEPSKLPRLEKDYWHVDQTLLGTQEVFRRNLTTRYMKEARHPSFEFAIKQTANPVDWSRRLKWAYAGDPEMRGTKYLVVARYVAASGRSRTKGGAEIEAASNVRNLVPFVFTQSAVTTPLHDVCEAGGKGLCELTGQNVGHR